MAGTVGKSHKIEQFHCPFLCLALGSAGDESRNHDILQCRKLRQKLVKLEYETDMLVSEISKFLLAQFPYINAVDINLASVGSVEGTDYL